MTRWKLAAAWVALQLVFFAGWAAVEQRRHTTGARILVRPVPVDPRDLLSGQYMALRYDFSEGRDPALAGEEGQTVWAVLRRDGEFHVVDRVQTVEPGEPPTGGVILRGRRERWRNVFGIEKYFVPEGTETPSVRDMRIWLRVSPEGIPRIEQVLVKGQPWP